MDIRQYIMKLLAAALLCGIAQGFFIEKSVAGAAIKLLCSMVMVLTVVSPWASLRLQDAGDYLEQIQTDGSLTAAIGENMAIGELRQIIKSRIEAYILDKAESYGARLTVEVILSDDQIPIPSSVRISGSISPYGKKMLSDMIRKDLGIEVEDQKWMG